MKKIIVALVLLAGITVVAYASFNNQKKAGIEKKAGKKECTRKCMFS